MSSTEAIWGFCEPIASWTHLAGAMIAVAIARDLWRQGRTERDLRAFAIFVTAASVALLMSGLYHALDPGDARAVLRRLDHAAIWLLIAGTITPVHLAAFRGVRRWLPLGIVWASALTGMVLKTVFFATFPEALGLVLYLALGWLGAISGVMIARRFGVSAIRPLWIGGLFYSVGGIVSVIETPPLIPGYLGHHELFHLAILAALFAHYRFVAAVVARGHRISPPPALLPACAS